jgi:hypothetical protein
MRPEPWKSCHPREKNWICHVTDPSYELAHAALCNSILCVEGGERWSLTLAQNLNVSLINKKVSILI